MQSIPDQHRALVLENRESGLELKTIPTPQPGPGSAVVRIEATCILPYYQQVIRHYPVPTPLVGGFGAIGRIAAVGHDAVTLKPGQLVYVDSVIHARDNPHDSFLSGVIEGFTDGSKYLMRHVWRDSSFAEYMKAPLENCIPLNEDRLCKELNYSIPQLMYLAYLLIPYGGLRDIGLEPGETIVICPATGGYGGAAVQVAVSMGAKVIAMGRSTEKLAKLEEHVQKTWPSASFDAAVIAGDEDKDLETLRGFGTIDAVLDLTPSTASASTHTKSAIRALRLGGRISLMGSTKNIGAGEILVNSITLKGKMMYERADILQFVKMMESGLFPRGEDFADVKTFALEDWEQGLDVAAEHVGIGKCAVFVPLGLRN
ncbi:alcohol dehydrogenase protein [Purpureocillium lilacinum]|uniref:Alcohol dehydrogenase protein n=1 Tax=Purpureocillium lilacinum TaxID=33203 RepID=A0A179HIP1_PURLI|nr:alcohol dehydrogenase protein [Purpureocillium lilacinum]OAQ89904.1 alcohol dehydrogenase protein [Purpureocillium lilacinum]